MSNPLVSIIIPVCNTEKYLPEAVESVLNQTYKNIEILIIDDCSTDRSLKIIQKYAKKDRRIKVITNNVNLGVTKTRNRAFRTFCGDFLAFLDSDDFWKDTKIQDQLDFLNLNTDVGIVGTNVLVINEFSKICFTRCYPENNRDIIKTLPIKNPFCQSSIMIRRNVIKEAGFYDESFDTSEDYDYWFRVLRVCRGCNIQKPLTFYRIRSGQLKQNKLKSTLLNTLRIQKMHIFTREYFSVSSLIRYLIAHLLLVLPNYLVLRLFLFMEEKEANGR